MLMKYQVVERERIIFVNVPRIIAVPDILMIHIFTEENLMPVAVPSGEERSISFSSNK